MHTCTVYHQFVAFRFVFALHFLVFHFQWFGSMRLPLSALTVAGNDIVSYWVLMNSWKITSIWHMRYTPVSARYFAALAANEKHNVSKRSKRVYWADELSGAQSRIGFCCFHLFCEIKRKREEAKVKNANKIRKTRKRKIMHALDLWLILICCSQHTITPTPVSCLPHTYTHLPIYTCNAHTRAHSVGKNNEK